MKLGLALGGGGARGLAHLMILETLESLGIRPHRIAGTSIGAIVGAIYASGASVSEMRGSAERLIRLEHGRLQEWFQNPQRPMHWLQFLSPEWGSSGLLNADRFLANLQERFQLTTLEAMPIRMQIVAADFWSREQVVFSTGDAITAIHASMAVPGILSPVPWEDRLLIDGGAVNPVPFDLLFDDCDITIAVDIMGTRSSNEGQPPNFLETLLGTFQIMQRSIINQQLAIRAPDIYLTPNIQGVRILEFNKADQIFEQSQPACDKLRESLERVM